MSIKEQAIKRMMAEEAARAVPMSSSDQVVIHQSDADVPGVYISSEQQQQDLYNRQLQQQAVAAQQMQQLPQQTSAVDAAMGNPNYRVVQPTTMTANEAGNIIIY